MRSPIADRSPGHSSNFRLSTALPFIPRFCRTSPEYSPYICKIIVHALYSIWAQDCRAVFMEGRLSLAFHMDCSWESPAQMACRGQPQQLLLPTAHRCGSIQLSLNLNKCKTLIRQTLLHCPICTAAKSYPFAEPAYAYLQRLLHMTLSQMSHQQSLELSI